MASVLGVLAWVMGPVSLPTHIVCCSQHYLDRPVAGGAIHAISPSEGPEA